MPLHPARSTGGIAQTTFDRIGEAIATFESLLEVNPFSSKYDYVMAGNAEFTPVEKAGYAAEVQSRREVDLLARA